MVSINIVVIYSELELFIGIVWCEPPLWHFELQPSRVCRLYLLALINQKFIILSSPKDPKESISSPEEKPPLDIRKSLGTELQGSNLFPSLLFLLATNYNFPSVSVTIFKIPYQPMLSWSKYFSHAGLESAY